MRRKQQGSCVGNISTQLSLSFVICLKCDEKMNFWINEEIDELQRLNLKNDYARIKKVNDL